MGVNDDASPLGDILANTVWMRRLAQTLVADAAERRRVGAASRAYVERVHDVERIADRLLDVYSRL